MSGQCIYLTAPQEAERLHPGNVWKPVVLPRCLCAWAQYHPDAVAAMAMLPAWLQGAALAGDLVRPDRDCARCAHFQAGDPVE